MSELIADFQNIIKKLDDPKPKTVSATENILQLPIIINDIVPGSNWKQASEGGEAIIYKTDVGKAAKVFRHWADPWFDRDRSQQEAAKVRFFDLQEKLKVFPQMPPEAVTPTAILSSSGGSFYGFEMKFVKGESIDLLRKKLDISEKLDILNCLFQFITKLHESDIVYGDMVPRDIIIVEENNKKIMRIVDVDSMQFGGFMCKTFTVGFADPKILTIKKSRKRGERFSISMKANHSKESDWYSFYAVCLHLLAGIDDPFEGTCNDMLDKIERVKENKTIFELDVTYPVTGYPLKMIPRNLLEAIFLTIKHNQLVVPESNFFNV